MILSRIRTRKPLELCWPIKTIIASTFSLEIVCYFVTRDSLRELQTNIQETLDREDLYQAE
jgi:hypothetical protein